MKDYKRNIDFVAEHYRKGCFNVESALRSIRPATRWWTPARIAAASVIAVALSATAAILVQRNFFIAPDVNLKPESSAPKAPELIVQVIDFEETPLPVVIDKIREVYGVKIEGVPENAEEYRLSLHYEGTAVDLLDTINDILGIQLSVKK